ncbi:MAG: tRNA pseudouridine(38-40) synthase TruA, partial [Actinomycetota bacterium]|nr:tRNA pseudouridine(38-40) synthase TruA [Actinomycetota bacterium]
FSRTLTKCELRELAPSLLCLVVQARSFLYKMVRIIAGVILEVGTGRMTVEELEGNLRDGDSPCCAPLPPHGLFLWEVSYPEDRIRPD